MRFSLNRQISRQRAVAVAGVAVAAIGLYAGAAAGSTRNVAATVDPALVDVNTKLGYQNEAAAGTGIVLTSNGIVLTNNHVIRGATSIRVRDLGNGRTYTATVVGYSVPNDMAVIQLENASGLQTATTGNSDALKLGAAVTAIGNAGGVGGKPSVTTGTITGLRKSITASDDQGGYEKLTGLIETDAALQPGDSGGALVNASGQVIGMNTAGGGSRSSFYFQQGASDGYAIPIVKALALVQQIRAGAASAAIHIGKTPLLGVQIEQPTGFELGGPVVQTVVSGGPADRAGIQPQDVITAIGGKKITTQTELTNALLKYQPQATIVVTWVDLYGTSHHATVQLASGPPQ